MAGQLEALQKLLNNQVQQNCQEYQKEADISVGAQQPEPEGEEFLIPRFRDGELNPTPVGLETGMYRPEKILTFRGW